ncbi:hypothetical protein PybrP1_003619 [[Pythium] brassicae (nom. inval.)]|nr:hypothetical protein PybrP1_003619 [[Pythium] brassicae (nom. inval.)]
MAAKLWRSTSTADWHAAFASYDDALASLQKDGLVALDDWMQNELPQTLRAREPAPFLTQAELARLMRWKLTKGKWRPQLMKFIDGLSDVAVRAASTKAFAELKSDALMRAVQALSELKGVGPATASAVLAAYDNMAPFMADEALEAIAHVIGARKYTLGHYMAFAEQMAAKAAWLTAQAAPSPDDDGSSGAWSAQRVQLCLYAAAHSRTQSGEVAASPAKATTAAKKRAAASKKASGGSDDSDDDDGSATTKKNERAVRAATRKRRRAGDQ